MNSIVNVWKVTVDDGEPACLIFDKLENALDYIRDSAFLGICGLGDTITLTLTQAEMTWSDYHKIQAWEL